MDGRIVINEFIESAECVAKSAVHKFYAAQRLDAQGGTSCATVATVRSWRRAAEAQVKALRYIVGAQAILNHVKAERIREGISIVLVVRGIKEFSAIFLLVRMGS